MYRMYPVNIFYDLDRINSKRYEESRLDDLMEITKNARNATLSYDPLRRITYFFEKVVKREAFYKIKNF